MWCPTCRTKVEDRPETAKEQATCPVCAGALVDPPAETDKPPASADKTNDALKLLARWSDQRMFSPDGEIPELKQTAPLEKRELDTAAPASSPSVSSQTARPARTETAHRPIARTEVKLASSGHEKPISLARASMVSPTGSAPPEPSPDRPPAPRVFADRSSAQPSRPSRPPHPLIKSPAAPPFDVQAAIREQLMTQERSWISAIGYLFSYGGISLLTAGAGLTLWSFYDQSLGNIPKEWLVTTVGQIFLFAGIVMLVSLVIERIGNKILFRLSQIDDRITRIERALSTVYDNQSSPTQSTPESKPAEVRKAG